MYLLFTVQGNAGILMYNFNGNGWENDIEILKDSDTMHHLLVPSLSWNISIVYVSKVYSFWTLNWYDLEKQLRIHWML